MSQRGQHREARHGQGDRSGRGRGARQERGKGRQATCEIPSASVWELAGKERRRTKAPGPMLAPDDIGSARLGEHEASGAERDPKANP